MIYAMYITSFGYNKAKSMHVSKYTEINNNLHPKIIQKCPGSVEIFTCSVIQGTALTWISESFIPENNPLRFMNSQTSIAGMPIGVGGFEITHTCIASTTE